LTELNVNARLRNSLGSIMRPALCSSQGAHFVRIISFLELVYISELFY
jgi:hypothetical protein